MTDLDVLIATGDRPIALAVTLTSLCAQTLRGFRVVVSDASTGAASCDDPAVQSVLRVLAHLGSRVEVDRHTGPEHRRHLLGLATSTRAVVVEDDLLLEPDALAELLAAPGDGRVLGPPRGQRLLATGVPAQGLQEPQVAVRSNA